MALYCYCPMQLWPCTVMALYSHGPTQSWPCTIMAPYNHGLHSYGRGCRVEELEVVHAVVVAREWRPLVVEPDIVTAYM